MGLLGISTDVCHSHGNLGDLPIAVLVGVPGCGRRATNFLDVAAHGVHLGMPHHIRCGGAHFLWGPEPGAQTFGLAKSSFHVDDKVVEVALQRRTKRAWATDFSEERSIFGGTVPGKGKRGTRTGFPGKEVEQEDEEVEQQDEEDEGEHRDEDGQLDSKVDPKKKLTEEECDQLKQRERKLREDAIRREDDAEKEMEDAMVRTAKGTEENHKTGVSNRQTMKVAKDMDKITEDTDRAEHDMDEETQLHAQWKASCSGSRPAQARGKDADGGAAGDPDAEEVM